MITLNPFVENNKVRINLFLNNLCEVGDFPPEVRGCNFDIPPFEVSSLIG